MTNRSEAELEELLYWYLVTPAGRLVEEFYPGASPRRHIALRTSLATALGEAVMEWLLGRGKAHQSRLDCIAAEDEQGKAP